MTQLLPASDLIIPDNRQRRDFQKKALADLAESIKDVGLLQPIVVREDGRTLVAGERRTRALQLLFEVGRHYKHNGQWVKDESYPYVRVDQLSADQLHAAELAENCLRVDLTWQERAKAQAELHKMRQAELPDGQRQTIQDTASEILGKEARGRQTREVADALLLAEYLDEPLVAHAPDIKTAKKAIKEAKAFQQRAQLVETHKTLDIPHELFLGDCFTAPLPKGKYSCIVTDPPYGIDAHLSDTFDQDKHEYDDSLDNFEGLLKRLPQYTYALAADKCHLYMFCDVRRFEKIYAAFEISGWWVWPRPLIWNKGAIGSFANIEHGPRSCYESIFYAIKGKKKANAGYRDIIDITQRTNTIHPAGKPVELYTELLKRSTQPNDYVLDLFAGGGTIFPAAASTMTFATGVELNPDYHALAHEQLVKIDKSGQI